MEINTIKEMKFLAIIGISLTEKMTKDQPIETCEYLTM